MEALVKMEVLVNRKVVFHFCISNDFIDVILTGVDEFINVGTGLVVKCYYVILVNGIVIDSPDGGRGYFEGICCVAHVVGILHRYQEYLP
jgi:hypothetical protein